MTYIILILSVLVGVLIVFGLKPSNKSAQLMLSFSGAYLLSISILHLLPEVYTSNKQHIGLFILLGLLLQLILEFFSKGAEHGHIHIHKSTAFPLALFLSLSIHAFLEGIPLANHNEDSHLLWAIVIHKVPIAIILATFFVNSNISKLKAVLFLIVFSLMSPFGNYIGESLKIIWELKTEITAVLIGIFLHISTIILFESAKDHKFNLYKFIAIIFGMVIAFLA